MDLIHLVIVLVIVGFILYLVQTYIPMAQPIKMLITVVIVICVCLWLLSAFGVGSYNIGPPVRR